MASTNRTAFWCSIHTNSVPVDPASTHHVGRNSQHFEKPTLTSGYFCLNAVWSSFTLHKTKRFCLWTFLPKLSLFFLAFAYYTHHLHRSLELIAQFLLIISYLV